jgi:urea carboxylase
MYGPHGAPDFFTDDDIQAFFAASWTVHFNSSRTGVRLVDPKPDWACPDGGEAGLHPSNIHDNAYAIGTIDFTGDMPVILGPDDLSLGGFVCPATVIKADLWKIGQLKAGDKVHFVPVSLAEAEDAEQQQHAQISQCQVEPYSFTSIQPDTPIVAEIPASANQQQVVYPQCGEDFLLEEYGPQVLDIRLRFRVHALMLRLEQCQLSGVHELTPGIRSLQIHYDNLHLPRQQLLDTLIELEHQLGDIDQLTVPARIVHLPLSWDDEATRLAIRKYEEVVRKDAPWCPDNIEFIRRINGLESVDDVKQIVFDASYLVMGLGDVYLGPPVATPLDPRHRLITTKYNPARTWTPENAVGIGGSYLCVYGMEGPGGYQFVGRTLQMWNRYRTTPYFQQPWLLQFFDQIRFYPVSADELQTIRRQHPRGQYPLKIETTTFSLATYQTLIDNNADAITQCKSRQQAAFEAEKQRWADSGQANFIAEDVTLEATSECWEPIPQAPAGCRLLFNHIYGLKPTKGLLSCRGVVPACRSLDCVTFFTSHGEDLALLYQVAASYDRQDSYARPDVHPLHTAPKRTFQGLRIGVPQAEQLNFFGNPAYQIGFEQVIEKLTALGAELVPFDLFSFLAAARILYQGPWVAERYAAIQPFFEQDA